MDGSTHGFILGDGLLGVNGFIHEGEGVLAFLPLDKPLTIGSKCTPKSNTSAEHLILFKNVESARVLRKKIDKLIKEMEALKDND